MPSFNPYIQQWPPWNEDRIRHLRDNLQKIRRRHPSDSTTALRTRIAHLLRQAMQLTSISPEDLCLALDIPQRSLEDIINAKDYPIEAACFVLFAFGLELDCRTIPDPGVPVDLHRWADKMRTRRDKFQARQLETSQRNLAAKRARKWCQRPQVPLPYSPLPSPLPDSDELTEEDP